MQGGMYAVLALFFLAVGVRDMTSDPPNLRAASWELLFAAANALYFWVFRGAPPWVKPAATGLFAVAVVTALADLFL